jgi:hypothetical protein
LKGTESKIYRYKDESVDLTEKEVKKFVKKDNLKVVHIVEVYFVYILKVNLFGIYAQYYQK